MKTDLADGQTLKEMFASGTAWLEKGAPDINAINVFPVPDGDTGTNMMLTMQFALEEAKLNLDNHVSPVAKSLAHGALMGARGNSGVILAQFFRGLAKGLEGKTHFDGGDFARALAEASQTAYKGIVNPVEGTILTVLKDASKAANEAVKSDDTLVSVLEAAVKSAEDSVARTPSLLPVLKEAGVVDAGGQGLYVLLDGALQFLKGESHKMRYRRPRLVVAETELVSRAAQMARAGATLDHIVDQVKKAIPRIHIRMTFDTLEYLRKGGRIGKAQAFLGGLLKVNHALGIKDGAAFPIARSRNRTQAMDLLVNFVKGFSRIEAVAIEDATTPDDLQTLAERLKDVVPPERIHRSKVSPVVGTHVGPHVLAVAVLEAE